MARIDWVQQRLRNWGLWKVKSNSTGLGYASSSVLLAVPSGGYRESPIPINEIEAELTDRAVEALRSRQSHLHMTLHLVYVQNTGISRAARLMCRADSTIKAQLEQADHALANWLTEHEEARRRARATDRARS